MYYCIFFFTTDPQKIPDCSSITPISSGSQYPSGFTDPTQVVGHVDVPIDRSMTVDYNR